MGTRSIIVKNISANMLLQIITAVGGFILPPLIVMTYGSATNGMLASIKQFIAYLTLLEAGIGAASIVALYQALAKQDRPLRNRILAATHHFYRISGSLFAVGLLILAALFAWLTHAELSPQLTFWMVLVMGSVNILDFFFFGTYRALLTADQKTYVISAVQAAAIVLNVAVSYILIKSGYSILVVQIASSAILISKFAIFSAYVRRHYTNLHLHYEPAHAFKLEQTWDALTHQLCALVIFSSPLVLITIFLSLKDASIYAIYALVFAAIKLALQSLSQGMQAVFGHTLNTDADLARYHFWRYERAFVCFLGWTYACTALLFMPFITLYTQHMHDADYHQPLLAMLFLLVGVVENIRIPSVTMIMAAGRYKATRPQALLEATLNLVCAIAFIQWWGLPGLLLGALVSFVYRSNEMLHYNAKYILHLPIWRSYALAGMVIGVLAACVGLARPLVNQFAVPDFVHWVALGAITATCLALPFVFTFWFTSRWRTA